MVIAFLAVSCDNAAGGKKNDDGKKTEQNQNGDGKTDPDQNGGGSSKDLTDEQLYDLMLLEEYLDFYSYDDELPLPKGVEIKIEEDETSYTEKITLEDYSPEADIVINGTDQMKASIETMTEERKSNLTITGMSISKVIYDVTIKFDLDSGEQQDVKGTITIDGKKHNVADIIEKLKIADNPDEDEAGDED